MWKGVRVSVVARTPHPFRPDERSLQRLRMGWLIVGLAVAHYSTSNSPAAPMPPPTHMVTTTYDAAAPAFDQRVADQPAPDMP